MSASNESMDRRPFLKRGAVFGLAAAGLASRSWAAPTLVSFQPPAALGGRSLLFLNGATQVPIPDPNVGKKIRFSLTGSGLRGTWNVDVIPPPYGLTGYDFDYTLNPRQVTFTGGDIEVHDITVRWVIRRKPGVGKLKPVNTDMTWQLEVAPANANTSPVTTSHTCTLALSLD